MSQQQRTILIVDDSPEDRELYRRYLLRDREYSYNILEATLGQQGLELWQQHQLDAILLDYRLPDLDGLEFLAQLQPSTQQPCLAVIVVTGQGNEAIAVQAMKAGAQDYLVKGQITPEGLQIAVNGAIETVQLRTQLQQRIERERLVGQITQQIHQSLNLDEILQTTVTEVRQFLHTDRVLVFRLKPDGDGTVIAESVGAEWRSLLFSTINDPCLAESYLASNRPETVSYDPAFVENYIERYRQGYVTAIFDIQDISIDPCHVELLAQFQVKANLVVPILQDHQFWGLLIAHHCASPRFWQPLEIDLLKELATQLSIALRQAELYQQAQHELKERQQVEAELRQSQEHLRLALSASRMGTWNWNIQTGKISWSDNLETLFGLEPGEFDGSFEMFAARLHQDDRDRLLAAVEHAVATGEDYDIEFRVVSPNGTIRWALSQGKVFYDENGQPMQMAGIDLDISDRKQVEEELRQSEERFRTLADNMSQFAWMADENGSVFWYNKRWFDYTDMTLEEMQGWGWQKVHHPDHLDRVVHHFRHCLATGELWEDTFPLRRQDGQYCWFLSRATPIRDGQGKILRWFGTNTDITERQQAEEERDRLLQLEQAARAEAERANRIKDEFLAVLSHELRSPLNPILGWTKLLQTRKFNETKTAEALATIERNAKLQTQLIDDLLDVAKILRGKLSIDAAPVNLAFVIESAIDTVRTAAIAKSITLHPILPNIVQVSGDSNRLQQIVWNLLSNAIKFTANRGRVEIRLERVDEQAQIIVSDTGKGINPDFLPHIFESFRQQDVSITRSYGGLGLGLAIVRQLVEAHGGIITADSPGEGLGATFTVHLPLLNVELEIKQIDELPQQALELTGIRVLTVDDDPDARELLTVLLAEYGASVLTVASASEVLANLESFQPDVLVSDIGMPKVDGYSLIKQIRTLPPEKGGQIPAIALTAYARVDDCQRAITSGYQRHVTKPLDPEELVQAVLALAQTKLNHSIPQNDLV